MTRQRKIPDFEATKPRSQKRSEKISDDLQALLKTVRSNPSTRETLKSATSLEEGLELVQSLGYQVTIKELEASKDELFQVKDFGAGVGFKKK